MAAPYSDDSRRRVFAAYGRGEEIKRIAEILQVRPSARAEAARRSL